MTERVIEIDGSRGEGGGQILRSALALSMATGRPFRMVRIRAGRAKPGLMRQHLTCVLAAAEVCDARTLGAEIGSQEVTFVPGPVSAGAYTFAVGSAGSTMLVLQAVMPALLRAGRSTVVVEGGTHCLAAPPFEFVERSLVPLLNRCGARVGLRMERHGFYPAGGGRIVMEVEPAGAIEPLRLMEAGARRSVRAWAVVSRIPGEIAVREIAALRARLRMEGLEATPVMVEAAGPGNALVVAIEQEGVTEVVLSLGEIGRSAERVARAAADEVRAYVAAGKPVGAHLADQLMVPLAVLGGGAYATGRLSGHAATNIETLRAFGARVEERGGVVEVWGLGAG